MKFCITILIALFSMSTLSSCRPNVQSGGLDLLGLLGTLNPQWVVSTFVGPAQGTTTGGYQDGTGSQARFNNPSGIVAIGTDLYVSEYWGHRIRKITAEGIVTTVAGSGVAGGGDATGTAAQFNCPSGLATDGTNLFVTENCGHKIRKIVLATGVVTTVAGTGGTGDADNATGTLATFNNPNSISYDASQNRLIVSDGTNNKIRVVNLATTAVGTLSGPSQGTTTSGDVVGTGGGNPFRYSDPAGSIVIGSTVYLNDRLNRKIKAISLPNGSTVAITAGPSQGTTTSGDRDGAAATALFSDLQGGMATNGSQLFIGDHGAKKIKMLDLTTQVVTTIAGGTPGSTQTGDTDGLGIVARFAGLQQFAVVADSNPLYPGRFKIYVCDYENNKIRLLEQK